MYKMQLSYTPPWHLQSLKTDLTKITMWHLKGKVKAASIGGSSIYLIKGTYVCKLILITITKNNFNRYMNQSYFVALNRTNQSLGHKEMCQFSYMIEVYAQSNYHDRKQTLTQRLNKITMWLWTGKVKVTSKRCSSIDIIKFFDHSKYI